MISTADSIGSPAVSFLFNHAKLPQNILVAGPELEALLPVPLCLNELSFRIISTSDVVVENKMVWIPAQSLLEDINRAIVVTVVKMDRSKLTVRIGVVRILLDHSLIERLCS